jgi:hypothetical protein
MDDGHEELDGRLDGSAGILTVIRPLAGEPSSGHVGDLAGPVAVGPRNNPDVSTPFG